MAVNPLVRLGALGQSPWYDFITRDLLRSGELRRLIDEDGLQGMTSNPTIFEKAIRSSRLYDEEIRLGIARGESPARVFETLAIADVRAACDIFRPLYDASDGRHGLVSIECNPHLARETQATIEEARRLWSAVDRPNVMIKIPGTREGLPAIGRCLADGLNVNITLLFSTARYEEVIEAYVRALEGRQIRGLPVDRIASVASFFVSRVDTKVDARLAEIGDPKGLRGKIAIANACTAYAAFLGSLEHPRWARLAGAGAATQRPLWASTSTKDPRYSDVHYVEALVAPDTVNTMPPETFEAYRDHGRPQVRIYDGIVSAPAHLRALADAGIDLARVTDELEDEGVAKFAASYDAVLEAIESKAGALAR